MIVVGVLLLPATGVTQSDDSVPRTPWGAPDFQGVWDFRTVTPLERPDFVADKEVLTDEEAAEFVRTAPERFSSLLAAINGGSDVADEAWVDADARGDSLSNNRTSLVVDPPNGKIPVQPWLEEQAAESFREAFTGRPDSYEDRGLSERCIEWTPTPFVPQGYNSNLQIFQTTNTVVILHEMIHDVRVIYLDGRPHLPDHVRQLRGSSRGRWEGDTLVVETGGFAQPSPFLSAGPNRGLVERFRYTDDSAIEYTFTIEDLDLLTQPYTVILPLLRTDQRLYEYACHEGNRSMTVMLQGARAQDREEATPDQ
jgi:hypothetical protein